ncbi:MAG TPA: LysR family transcriptional regulator [Alcanivorax sp.]|jgi:DNA-binding transcriptional LysR family regulator|nr:LysR family transcriptional regulator [Alcanivorax sp.]HAI24264.1 LysR family transcriptional regulator [Alcanivorax sp.]HAS30302.1 LysR family transcriptional regulator [Alcanivorax sp.]HAV69592.1 LysR family transcriptional regulator [Alcanivorax sp.]HBP74619.1 LysR family transcriptional regulator [Alcanivorax sp.]|tara:strand:- start:3228 stop:4127 length:900 start_codon:yes stop_codon:yes gene_type:complete
MTVAKARPENASLPLLDTDTLRTFVAIAENGSFTRAAHQVFRTPSALSMQIKRLEETLGQSLFIREARRVSLTPEGEVLLGYGRRLLKLNEEAVGRFLAPSLEGSVRLGTPDDVGTRVLPQVLTRFARSHPAVQVNVNAGRSIDLLKRLDDGELDLALVTLGHSDLSAKRGEVVHTEPLVWAGRDGGVAVQRSPLPLSLANHGCAWREMALGALDKAEISYRVAYNSEHCAGQEAAMLADLAVAPFPASLVQPPLRVLGPENGLPALGDYQIALVRRDGSGPAAEALAEQVVQTFRERR